MRKLLPFVCIVLLLTSCIFGVLYFLSSEDKPAIVEEPINKTVELRSSVETGIITSTLAADGNVIGDSPDIYMESISVDFVYNSDKSSFETDYKRVMFYQKTPFFIDSEKRNIR